MRTKPDTTTRRGGLASAVLALGLALAVGAGVSYARTPAPPVAESAVVEPVETPSEPGPPVESEPLVEPVKTKIRPGVPVRLVIPALGVNAPVVPAQAPGGTLQPPDDPQTLGWWADGAKPGARHGSALITGHTMSTGGAAFQDLETLQAGDPVRVRTTRGPIDYAVSSIRIYRKARLTRHAEQLFSQEVPGRIVLITCEDWNGSVYLSNAVVIAEPAG